MVNIKTKEYEKNKEIAVNSVWESNYGRQKLFGKTTFDDVKYNQCNKKRSAVKNGLAGVKEKAAGVKVYPGGQKAGGATCFRGLK